tara:strand:- start:1211 stop:2917 length:1707 start_codon:yes stop_codon:yes gene_type:complete
MIFIKDNLKLLNKKELIKLNIIIIISVTCLLLEVVTAGLVYPLITSLLEPDYKFKIFNFDVNNLFNDYSYDLSLQISILFLIFLIFFIKSVIFSFNVFFSFRTLAQVNRRISTELYSKYMSSGWTTISKKSISTILRNLTTESLNYPFKNLTSIINLINDFVLIVGLISLLIIIEARISILAILFVCFCGFFLGYITRNYNINFGKIRAKQSKFINKHIVETFRAIRNIKIMSKEKYFFDTYDNNYLREIRARANQAIIQQLPKGILELIGIFTIFIVLYFFYLLDFDIPSATSYIGVFLVCMIRLIPSINRILFSLQALRFGKATLKILSNEFYDLERKENDINKSSSQKKLNGKFEFLEFKDVDFSYENRKSIFSKLNFIIKKNEIVGISGETGKGKSTLLDLICGFLRQDSGKISINDQELKDIKTDWQKKVGFVFQETYLLDVSLKNNIAFGYNEDQIDTVKVMDSIKKAQLESFVKNLKEGINEKFGDIGLTLSGGQKQRIGIARAMYNDPEILILDESTSSLDIETEENILKLLKELSLNCTIIIVSHKQNTLKICDKLIKL